VIDSLKMLVAAVLPFWDDALVVPERERLRHAADE
jgi:hypothetical protein